MGTWREKDLCTAFVIKIINSARMLNYIYKMCMVYSGSVKVRF